MVFRDRADAGAHLAEALATRRWTDPLVLALPRGGVPVAAPVASALGAPLDVVAARKVGAPGRPELGIGALCEGSSNVVWHPVAERLDLTSDEKAARIAAERTEIARRVASYRDGRALPPLTGRDVVLVDDGLATGVTAEAALVALGAQGPRSMVLAVPVGAPDTVARLEPLVAAVVCLQQPEHLRAVGSWYEDFTQITDDQVRDLLAGARRGLEARP